jgi:hypothetical protein
MAPGTSSVPEVLRSPGRPLDAASRAYMEPRFGHDFSQVRIHDDALAAESARSVAARAYTVGEQIVFAAGQSARDWPLLAHELAHVVQQTSGAAPPTPGRLLRQPRAAQPTGTEWFGGSRTPGKRGLADQETPDCSIRNDIVVEKQPTFSVVSISVGSKTADIAIRYAFPSSEIVSGGGIYQWGESSTITTAKNAINNALKKVLFDVQNYSTAPGSSAGQVREDRLTAMLTQFSPQTPLNIFLSVNPADQTPFTSSVTINATNASKEAATLIPTQMFSPGRIAAGKPSGAASPQEIQQTVLHETTHDSLIRSHADSESVWNTRKMALVPSGSENLADQFLEVAHSFVIAQEEMFTYATEESLYPPVAAPGSSAPATALQPQHAAYRGFISVARSFLAKKRVTMQPISLPVVSSGGSVNVSSWRISYDFPVGTVNLSSNDEMAMQLLMTSWTNAHAPARGMAASKP